MKDIQRAVGIRLVNKLAHKESEMMCQSGAMMSARAERYTDEASAQEDSNSHSYDALNDPNKVHYIRTQIDNDVRCLPAPSQLFKRLLNKKATQNHADNHRNQLA